MYGSGGRRQRAVPFMAAAPPFIPGAAVQQPYAMQRGPIPAAMVQQPAAAAGAAQYAPQYAPPAAPAPPGYRPYSVGPPSGPRSYPDQMQQRPARPYGGDYGGGRGGYSGGGGYFSRGGGASGYGAPRRPYVDPIESEREPVEKLFEQAHSGINFDKFDDIPVEVMGGQVPPPLQSFAELDGVLESSVLENIKRSGYNTPTPVQKHGIPIVLAALDVMACAQTGMLVLSFLLMCSCSHEVHIGSGKTAAFLVPLLSRILREGRPPYPPPVPGQRRKAFPLVLVLAPTRELACQIYDEARKFAYQSPLRVCVAYGGSSIRDQLIQLERGCDILVATPGRLVDMMERARVSLQCARFLVLDEADRMLDMVPCFCL